MPEPLPDQGAARVPYACTVTVSELADVGPLFRRLTTIPEATVTRQHARPEDDELGGAEVLQLLVPSAAVLSLVIRTLPAFIRSRRSSVTVTITRGDRSVTVDGTNLPDPEEVLEITQRLIGDD
ncbi:hypothetical protein BLA60_39315 [Actinophytocola xinjiangensis]|uniref:Uncharacterized protein n=1 Tax=Actinophytocola xinjiangensis TaxID=485602 RepID=A0A7Z0WDD8_9PSEU|nr:hypothetical protein [Actinophytocola xinjiangensis]OLF04784.1 hypothetical protein BLA60_39315 [Actinophytocola xinjiangensis]